MQSADLPNGDYLSILLLSCVYRPVNPARKCRGNGGHLAYFDRCQNKGVLGSKMRFSVKGYMSRVMMLNRERGL